MAIYPMSEILNDARQKKYAVGCYNAINLDMIRGVILAAEEEQSPVILCHAQVHFKYTPLEMIAPVLIHAAKDTKVPVAILLDHGSSFDAMVKAMKLGFNAVMFDGSTLSYDDNVSRTKEIVKIAKVMDVEIEAELGHVTRPKSAGADGEEEDSVIDDTSLYTDPVQAGQFVEQTGIDALAVAFGTAHGIYLNTPKLDFVRLKEIHDSVSVPLVMHGGSGLSGDDFELSVKNGICKINYYTGMAVYAAQMIKQELDDGSKNHFYHNIMMRGIEAIKEDVQRSMKIFKSSNQI